MKAAGIGGGFTLLELLFSLALLSALVCGVVEVVNRTAALTTESQRHLRADRQARLVFARMAADFSRMPIRTDLDYLFSKQDGIGEGVNDKVFFYSAGPGYFSSSAPADSRSPLALIGYRINSKMQLERLGKGLSWSGASSHSKPGGMAFLSQSANENTPLLATTLAGHWPQTIGTSPDFDGADFDYHLLADSVFRFEFCFQYDDGSFGNSPRARHDDLGIGLSGIAGIVVGIAVLDGGVPLDLATVKLLGSELHDSKTSPNSARQTKLMGAQWRHSLSDPSLAQRLHLPEQAPGSVRVYQRTFAISDSHESTP